ncbi:MAG: hypothetical protein V1898_02105 [Patescibacteria group bacterium]
MTSKKIILSLNIILVICFIFSVPFSALIAGSSPSTSTTATSTTTTPAPEKTYDFSLGFDKDGKLKSGTDLGNTDPATIAFSVINNALFFLGVITVIMIVFAGFMWVFAAGEEEKIKKAQGILKGALLGLFVIIASYGIVSYIFGAIKIATLAHPEYYTL